MFLKKILFSLAIGVILCPLAVSVVLAQEDTSEAVISSNNPLCWKKTDCADAREAFGEETAADGWVQEDPCTGDWGKCLAGQITQTSISFGGKKSFANLGDYIKTIYNYALMALGILAVVMIVVSGAQWISSAGNTEVISSSKKRIGGAVIGLFIAFMSYNILNSINPALVNLRLPQVWMIRPDVTVVDAGDYCDPVSGSETKLACEQNGDKICIAVGYNRELRGACMILAEYVAESSVFILDLATGGAAKGLTVGAKVLFKQVLKNTVANVIKTTTKIAAEDLAKYTSKQVFKEVLKGAGKKMISFGAVKTGAKMAVVGVVSYEGCKGLSYVTMDTMSCGKILLAVGNEIKEIPAEALDEFFTNHNGICVNKARDLSKGALCDISDQAQCQSGKCVKAEGITEMFECWSTLQIGVCATGDNQSICNSEGDCLSDQGYHCNKNLPVAMCSNGAGGAPCNEDDNCLVGETCEMAILSGPFGKDLGFCTGVGSFKTGDFCERNSDCGTDGVCMGMGVRNDEVLCKPVSIDTPSNNWGLWSTSQNYPVQKNGVCVGSGEGGGAYSAEGMKTFHEKASASGYVPYGKFTNESAPGDVHYGQDEFYLCEWTGSGYKWSNTPIYK